jgi:hypothetical protein
VPGHRDRPKAAAPANRPNRAMRPVSRSICSVLTVPLTRGAAATLRRGAQSVSTPIVAVPWPGIVSGVDPQLTAIRARAGGPVLRCGRYGNDGRAEIHHQWLAAVKVGLADLAATEILHHQ